MQYRFDRNMQSPWHADQPNIQTQRDKLLQNCLMKKEIKSVQKVPWILSYCMVIITIIITETPSTIVECMYYVLCCFYHLRALSIKWITHAFISSLDVWGFFEYLWLFLHYIPQIWLKNKIILFVALEWGYNRSPFNIYHIKHQHLAYPCSTGVNIPPFFLW